MKKIVTGIRTIPYKDVFIVQVDRYVPNSVPPLIENRQYKYKYTTSHILTVIERFAYCIIVLNRRIVLELNRLNRGD